MMKEQWWNQPCVFWISLSDSLIPSAVTQHPNLTHPLTLLLGLKTLIWPSSALLVTGTLLSFDPSLIMTPSLLLPDFIEQYQNEEALSSMTEVVKQQQKFLHDLPFISVWDKLIYLTDMMCERSVPAVRNMILTLRQIHYCLICLHTMNLMKEGCRQMVNNLIAAWADRDVDFMTQWVEDYNNQYAVCYVQLFTLIMRLR